VFNIRSKYSVLSGEKQNRRVERKNCSTGPDQKLVSPAPCLGECPAAWVGSKARTSPQTLEIEEVFLDWIFPVDLFKKFF